MLDRNTLMQKQRELEQRREELLKRLENISSHYKQGLSADMEDQAIELESEEVISALEKRAQGELDEVERDLRKIAEALSRAE